MKAVRDHVPIREAPQSVTSNSIQGDAFPPYADKNISQLSFLRDEESSFMSESMGGRSHSQTGGGPESSQLLTIAVFDNI